MGSVSKRWDQGSEGWDRESQPGDQGSGGVGSGSTVLKGIRDQAVQFLRDQEPKFFDTFFRNLGTKMGSAMKKIYLVTTLLWITLLFRS